MDPIVRDELYRITREALRNAFSHARAQNIEVELTYSERLLRLRIRDDGNGIAPEMLEGRSGQYGLQRMRERAKEIGATIRGLDGMGTGTEIDLSTAGSIAYLDGRSRSFSLLQQARRIICYSISFTRRLDEPSSFSLLNIPSPLFAVRGAIRHFYDNQRAPELRVRVTRFRGRYPFTALNSRDTAGSE